MGISRYHKRDVIKNISLDYIFSDVFRKRGLSALRQFRMAQFKELTPDELADLQVETKIWGAGEKYFKLAHEFYGDPEYWWIIAWYNQKPLESDFKPGDIVEIPLTLDLILEYFNIL